MPTALPTLTRHDAVFVLRFADPTDPADAPDNAFTAEFLDALDAALGEVESSEGQAALVTTGAGKFYSTGLDLEIFSGDPAAMPPYLTRVHGLFARMLRLETPTVAAVGGHAFGAGAMLTLCHDHRVMRTDRGYWSLPEAGLAMPFPAAMNALITKRLDPRTAGTAMLTSRRYPGAEAMVAGIVHEAADDADAALDRAITVATELASLRGANYAGIRAGLVAEILPHLDEPVTDI